EIQAFGWRSLGEVLSSLPGMYTTYDRQYGYLGTRGFGLPGDYNTRILIAINGNRLNDAVYDAAMTGREFPVDMNLIERIEVLAGPGGAIYGQNAMLGVVNVITRKGQQVDGGELTASYQDLQRRYEGGLRWGKVLANGVDVMVSASGLQADGADLYMRYPGAGPGGTDVVGDAAGLDGEHDEEFFARIGKNAWSFELMSGAHRKDDPTGAFFSDPLTPERYQADLYQYLHLQYAEANTDELTVFGRLFVGRERYTSLADYDGVPNFSTGSSNWYGAEGRLLYTALPAHKLLLGVELQDNARADQTTDDLIRPGLDLNIPNDGYRAGIFVQDEWQFALAWSTSLGLRLDRNNVTGTKASPRAALIWRADQDTTVKALYGRAHRAPNTYEADYDDGLSQLSNRQLDGESINTYELLVDRQLSRRLSVQGSLYRWVMQDIITLGTEPVSGLSQYQSGADVYADGIELSGSSSLGAGSLLRASVSWQEAHYDGGRELANAPHWLARLNYQQQLPWAGLRAGIEVQYDDNRLTNAGVELDGSLLTNVTLRTNTAITGLELSLSVLNLFDESYAHPAPDSVWQDSLPQDGRSVRLRMDYRF
ncbi:MAG: TonB-dependent receptor, partial [Pseudomonadota bacterium]